MSTSPSSPRAKKHFGQNFLHDPSVLEAVVRACAPQPGQLVVELGAGTGNLTEVLARHADQVLAVERDRDMLPLLRERFAGSPHVTLLEADAKALDLADLARGQPVLLCGNIPYHLSAPLLGLALDAAELVDRVVFMVQRELGQRLAASAGTRACGALSVLLQQRFDLDLPLRIGRGAFKPAPRVDSVLLRLQPQHPPRHPVDDATLFSRVVHTAFAQRRKQLGNALGRAFPDVDGAFLNTGIAASRRAESLTMAEWVSLTRALDPGAQGG
ncbi:MAG: 16S rRNA (adenine(1518)-N(6)/adenine(1519)-N(6))-dimethyltransferase RsmA [Pseudomonadota bacterium]